MASRLPLVIAWTAALAACGGNPGTGAEQAPPTAVAPAIIPPEEAADPAEPPSYEVGIASAAATHNQALERCRAQPAAVRTECEQEANAAFADAQAKLQNLRGNQQ
jgi:hypothetical protein